MTPITLRAVRADDASAMQRFVLGLDPASRRRRFHGAVNDCSGEFLRLLTDADGQRHVAFVACQGGEVVGEARYHADEEGRAAEFAIAVAGAVRGRGVADELLGLLQQTARRAGLQRLHGDVLHDNAAMAKFMRRHGFEIDVWAVTDEGAARWDCALDAAPRAAARWVGRVQAWWKRAGPYLPGSSASQATVRVAIQ